MRSVLAIVVGFVFIALLSFGADALLRSALPGAFNAAGRTDSVNVLLLTLAYVAVFAVAGCYLTARLAPSRPMWHALVLGLLGLIFTIVGTIAMWDAAPPWYNIVSLVLVMPYAWIGGKLAEHTRAPGGKIGRAHV